jgi:hypothetical protein
MDKNQGSPFSEGRGRGFDIPKQKSPATTNEERNRRVELDLADLNRPGVGPVNFQPKKGTDFDQEMRKGGSDGDADGDSQVY